MPLGQQSGLLTRNLDSRRAGILFRLWRDGPISRGQLADLMSLNLPTVSAIVQDLIKEEELIEEGFATSTGGRKAQLLDVNPRRGGIVAIEFSSRGVLSASADMKGRLHNHTHRPFDVRQGQKEALEAIFRAVDDQRDFLNSDENLTLKRIGIVTSGPVDAEKGVSISFPRFEDWRDVNLAQLLSDHYEVPVNLANHVVATTLAETIAGRYRETPNFFYVHLGPGLGCGIVIDGYVYRGPLTTVGELGHFTVDNDGPICYCGNYGCLETKASDYALLGQVEAHLREGVQSSIPEHYDDDGRLSVQAIFRAAEMGDRLAGNIIDKAGHDIGTALASAVNLLAPRLVLFGGSMAEDGARLLQAIRHTLKRRALQQLEAELRFELGTFGAQAGVKGAVCVALHSHYNSFTDP